LDENMAKKTFSEYVNRLLNCEDASGAKIGQELNLLYGKLKSNPVKNFDAYTKLHEKISHEQKVLNKALGKMDIIKKMHGALLECLIIETLNAENLQKHGLEVHRTRKIKVWEGFVPKGSANFEKGSYEAEFDVVVGKAVGDDIVPVVAISCKSDAAASDIQAEALRFMLLKQVYPKVTCVLLTKKYSIDERLRHILGGYVDGVFALNSKESLEKFVVAVKESLREFVIP
jgi:hypothetical protein